MKKAVIIFLAVIILAGAVYLYLHSGPACTEEDSQFTIPTGKCCPGLTAERICDSSGQCMISQRVCVNQTAKEESAENTALG